SQRNTRISSGIISSKYWMNLVNQHVCKITLPQKTDAAHTYIKEAIKAYPDLYFSKLVVLGEGDSEEIILPKLLSASDILLDDFNISVVPLGGRHVNHMWKLLNDLSIPHVTLLDLDRERGGGGWGRIKYVLQQLKDNNRISEDTLKVKRQSGVYIYTMDEVESFHNRKVEDVNSMDVWIKKLEKEDIFFSYPLDIDFSMLLNFESEYHSTMSQGPRGINDESSEEYIAKLDDSIKATLKSSKATGKTYTAEEHKAMIWYNSLFLGRGKPSTHIEALKEIDNDRLIEKAPPELLKLVNLIKEKIGFSNEG
ncbi:MAG: ATP-dependent endonuclease, partial [Bacilli bacterium]